MKTPQPWESTFHLPRSFQSQFSRTHVRLDAKMVPQQVLASRQDLEEEILIGTNQDLGIALQLKPCKNSRGTYALCYSCSSQNARALALALFRKVAMCHKNADLTCIRNM